jgi:hypothetical protein
MTKNDEWNPPRPKADGYQPFGTCRPHPSHQLIEAGNGTTELHCLKCGKTNASDLAFSCPGNVDAEAKPVDREDELGSNRNAYADPEPAETGRFDPGSVPDLLAEFSELYQMRNRSYGDNYKNFGQVMAGLFPHGLDISTADDWNRLGVFIQVVNKIGRYAHGFDDPQRDSTRDISVYAAMLTELDDEFRRRRTEGMPF